MFCVWERLHAARYQCGEVRRSNHGGHYDYSLTATSGDVTRHIPRFKTIFFETVVIDCYRRCKSRGEEALIQMHLAGAWVERVKDFTEVLWDCKISASAIRKRRKKAHANGEPHFRGAQG